jgi:hypothetical protein
MDHEERKKWIRELQSQFGDDSQHTLKEYQKAYNLERVRGYLETHLGAQLKDIMRSLEMSENTARYYMNQLRCEWRGKPGDK